MNYTFGLLPLLGRRPAFVISDRVRYVNIDQLFLNSYIKLLIKVCHKRGALATGGMAALILEGVVDAKLVNQKIEKPEIYVLSGKRV